MNVFRELKVINRPILQYSDGKKSFVCVVFHVIEFFLLQNCVSRVKLSKERTENVLFFR